MSSSYRLLHWCGIAGRASIVAFIGLCDVGSFIAASLRQRVKGAKGEGVAAAPDSPSWQLSFGELRAAVVDVPRPAPPALIEDTPGGDGHAVLLLPPLFGGDWQMQPLRDFLTAKGYAAYGWTLGPNLGPTDRVLQGVERRLDDIRARHGGTVTLIGHSLGGLLARELAKKRPDAVRRVIALAAPIHMPVVSPILTLFRLLSFLHSDAAASLASRLNEPPSVPVTSIYTRSDGIVAWQSCLEEEGEHRENVEIAGAHGTMALDHAAWRIIAERLARPATPRH